MAQLPPSRKAARAQTRVKTPALGCPNETYEIGSAVKPEFHTSVQIPCIDVPGETFNLRAKDYHKTGLKITSEDAIYEQIEAFGFQTRHKITDPTRIVRDEFLSQSDLDHNIVGLPKYLVQMTVFAASRPPLYGTRGPYTHFVQICRLKNESVARWMDGGPCEGDLLLQKRLKEPNFKKLKNDVKCVGLIQNIDQALEGSNKMIKNVLIKFRGKPFLCDGISIHNHGNWAGITMDYEGYKLATRTTLYLCSEQIPKMIFDCAFCIEGDRRDDSQLPERPYLAYRLNYVDMFDLNSKWVPKLDISKKDIKKLK